MDMADTLQVVAIGQFPPPITGFSYITQQIVAQLANSYAIVSCDIASAPGSKGARKHLSRMRRTLAAVQRLASRRHQARRACYIACDGDLGLIYTIVAAAAARWFGYPVFLHHHSFGYIDQPHGLMKLLLAVSGDITHVFLCSRMRDAFEARYRRILRSHIISNAAFVPPQESPERAHDREIWLGHLSNLTREKGLYDFLDLLRALDRRGQPFRGILAGPAALPEDRAAIAEAVRDLGGRLEYRGPQFGADKNRFYREVDVFVFPTDYANEAQPTVLFEALAAGNLVVSYDRGCIAAQVGEDGLVLSRGAAFVEATAPWLAALIDNPAELRARRRASWTRYCATQSQSLAAVDELLESAGPSR